MNMPRTRLLPCLLLLLPVAGCGAPTQGQSGAAPGQAGAAPATTTLRQARAGHATKVRPPTGEREAVETPPSGVFNQVSYPAAPGALAAYLSPDPRDGKRHP